MDAFLRGQTSQSGSSKLKQSSNDGGAGPSTKKPSIVPWVEKYRPRSVDEVAYQEEVVAVLKKTLDGADLPNLLFYGPPGTGKTSTILAISRQLYGPALMRERVLELNASDERGIQVVRDKVKHFAQLAASSVRPDGKPCPPYKIVILDEADSMTPSAQAALRRTMEKQTKTTRFCLICNYVSRIIEPLTSRCSKFRFKPLSVDILEKRLNSICKKENVKCDSKAIQELIKISEGDLRKAITSLQSAHRLKGDVGIVAEDIIDTSGVVPDNFIEDLFQACRSDSYEKVEAVVKEMIAEGHAATQLISQMHDIMVDMNELSDHQKSAISEKTAIVDKCLCDGADEYLQILSLCTVIMQQLCHAG